MYVHGHRADGSEGEPSSVIAGCPYASSSYGWSPIETGVTVATPRSLESSGSSARVVARSVRQAPDAETGLVRGQEAAVTSAIAAMSAGPTRQQPPTSCAPALIQLRTALGSKVPAPAHACEALSQASPRFG